MTATSRGYAPVNGLGMYYEAHGEGSGPPMILLHGGFGLTSMFGELLPRLAASRQVIAVDLQGHGRTRDIDRPMSYRQLGDDVAGVMDHLGLERADLMGYSLGGGTAVRAAIQHPGRVRRLVLVSTPFSSAGWYPDIQAGMAGLTREAFEHLKPTPMYEAYAAVAPDIEAFPALMDKLGAMMARPYDWSAEIARLELPLLLIYGDADSIPPAHIAKFFGLFGGGTQDGGWDRAGVSRAQLAIVPSTTHYEIFSMPQLADYVDPFLDR